MAKLKNYRLIFFFLYFSLFLLGFKTLFHGFPDIERFFAEWMDERLTLNYIMKLGIMNFAPTEIWHPPLYHYLVFIPIVLFYFTGKLLNIFCNQVDFVRFFFYNTHYFFLIGRIMSYIFYWLSSIMLYKISRLFYRKAVSHATVLIYLLIPRFIFDFSTTRPETLLFLNASLFFYFFLKFYLTNKAFYLFCSGFLLGVTTATKYNAIFLSFIFIPLFFYPKNKLSFVKNITGFTSTCLKLAFFIILGFFVCDPYFFIQFNKYFNNFLLYHRESMYYWYGMADYPVIFLITHIKELCSVVYINIAGGIILLFGSLVLFKKDKRLLASMFFCVLVYEVYFGGYQNKFSPLRYLNPLLPIVALIFASGVDFIIMQKKRLMPVFLIFILILFYNYVDIWHGLSVGPTSVQKARAYIEKEVPEFTKICVTSNQHMPQLNMTKESYFHLIETAPIIENIKGHEINYIKLDSDAKSSSFREIRLESLTQKPQYNLIRWNKGIKTEKEAINFLRENKIAYVASFGPFLINKKKLESIKNISLVKIFKSNNRRISADTYLYRVEFDNQN